MSEVNFFAGRSLPAPVMAAAIAIVATRIFNLLMIFLLPDGGESGGLLHQLSMLPGYMAIFSLGIGIFITETVCAVMLLNGCPRARKLFIGCQCLLVVLVLAGSGWEGAAGVLGGDSADTQQLGYHILLQKIPDIIIILMLCLPASSREFFNRKTRK